MWGYRFGYTAAQIELAVTDAPLICYKKDKKKGNRGKDGKRIFETPDALRILEAQRKWDEQNANRKDEKIHFSFGSMSNS